MSDNETIFGIPIKDFEKEIEDWHRTLYHEAGHAVMHYLKNIPFKYVQVNDEPVDRYFEERDGKLVPIDLAVYSLRDSEKEEGLARLKAREGVIIQPGTWPIQKVEPIEGERDPLLKFWDDEANPETPKHSKALAHAESLLMICVAGAVAEMISINGTFERATIEQWYDSVKKYEAWDDFFCVASKTAHVTYLHVEADGGFHKWLDWLIYRVERMYRKPLYWAMVEAVAYALESGKALTYKEVSSICRSAQRDHKKQMAIKQPNNDQLEYSDGE